MKTPRHVLPQLAAGLLLVLSASPGCGRVPGAAGSVSGKVLFNGRPLPSGSVLFVRAGGGQSTALIRPDGTYRIDDAPLGTVKVAIASHAHAPAGLERPAHPAPGNHSRPVRPAERTPIIPPHYNDPERSGLTFSVQEGEQTFDIILKP
jgi:hypothetical protein